MFNFGSDDKEELQENMQEIKGMIQGDKNDNRQGGGGFDGLEGFDQGNSGEQSQRSQSQVGQNQGQPSKSTQGSNQGLNQNSQELGGQNSEGDFSQNDNLSQGNKNAQQEDFDPFAPDENEQKESQVGQRVKVPGQPGSNSNPDQNANDNVVREDSEPDVSKSSNKNQEKAKRNEAVTGKITESRESNSSTREINRNDGPSADEPLFLREENFVDVREMIEEMGYLARELQENLDGMKETVHKEKEYAKDAQEVVNAYSDRRGDIEDIIKTGQK